MGKVMSVAVRKVRRFNAENRAHNYLEKTKDKPTAAPAYEANLKELKRILSEQPEITESLKQKNLELDERLKKVFVTSADPTPIYAKPELDPNKPLPLDRQAVNEFEYGFKEPYMCTPGRITLRHAVEFITKHQAEPDKWSADRIARDYKLEVGSVVNVLKHFNSFECYIPKKKDENSSKKLLSIDASLKRLKGQTQSEDMGQKKTRLSE